MIRMNSTTGSKKGSEKDFDPGASRAMLPPKLKSRPGGGLKTAFFLLASL
jgi:hypothetical protein